MSEKHAEDYLEYRDDGWVRCILCGHMFKASTAEKTEITALRHMSAMHALVTNASSEVNAPTFLPPARNGKSPVRSNSIDHMEKLWRPGASNVKTYKYMNNQVKEV